MDTHTHTDTAASPASSSAVPASASSPRVPQLPRPAPTVAAVMTGEYEKPGPVTLGVSRTDSGARDWVLTFSRELAAHPAAYHVSEEQADAVFEKAEEYDRLYHAANHPDTRTQAAIARKDHAKKAALDAALEVAAAIKADIRIPTESKLRLGMKRMR